MELEEIILRSTLVIHEGDIASVADFLLLDSDTKSGRVRETRAKIHEYEIDLKEIRKLPKRKSNQSYLSLAVAYFQEQFRGIGEKKIVKAFLEYYGGNYHIKKTARFLRTTQNTIYIKIEELDIDVNKLKKKRLKSLIKELDGDVGAVGLYLDIPTATIMGDIVALGMDSEIRRVSKHIKEIVQTSENFREALREIGLTEASYFGNPHSFRAFGLNPEAVNTASDIRIGRNSSRDIYTALILFPDDRQKASDYLGISNLTPVKIMGAGIVMKQVYAMRKALLKSFGEGIAYQERMMNRLGMTVLKDYEDLRGQLFFQVVNQCGQSKSKTARFLDISSRQVDDYLTAYSLPAKNCYRNYGILEHDGTRYLFTFEELRSPHFSFDPQDDYRSPVELREPFNCTRQGVSEFLRNRSVTLYTPSAPVRTTVDSLKISLEAFDSLVEEHKP